MDESTPDQTFRERLLAEIDASNKKLAEIARQSGVSYNVLVKLKRGDNQTTSAENADRLRKYFGWPESSQHGELAEPPGHAPTPRGDAALRDVVAGKVRNRAGDLPGSRQVAVVNGVIQIAATIGPDDVEDLIEELQDARRMAERHLRRRDRNTE